MLKKSVQRPRLKTMYADLIIPVALIAASVFTPMGVMLALKSKIKPPVVPVKLESSSGDRWGYAGGAKFRELEIKEGKPEDLDVFTVGNSTAVLSGSNAYESVALQASGSGGAIAFKSTGPTYFEGDVVIKGKLSVENTCVPTTKRVRKSTTTSSRNR